MYIREIKLKNYRNYSTRSFSFSPEGSLITGKNGIGKTNLLEAISYSAFGKSVRLHPDQEIIQFKEKSFFIEALFVQDDKEYKFKIFYEKNRKRIKLNNNAVTKISLLYSYVKVVYFSSEDIWIITGSRLKRRAFFDQAITQTSLLYSDILIKYYRVVEQRNAILKDRSLADQLDYWNKAFIEKAIELHKYRVQYLAPFCEKAEDILNKITDSQEAITIDYIAHNKVVYEEEFLNDYLVKIKESEFEARRTLIGPHLDEYQLNINGYSAKRYSSQGQKRTLAIALRFAQLQMITKYDDHKPIIIFDDALSELDKARVEEIFALFDDTYQILVASPNTDNYTSFNLPEINLQKDELDEIN